MRWAAAVVLVLGAGCETAEVTAWKARRGELSQRLTELQELAREPGVAEEARAVDGALATLLGALDVAAVLRGSASGARVLSSAGGVVVQAEGPVEACAAAAQAAAPARWLLPGWRLRLEAGRCTWEARSGPDLERLEALLHAPSERAWAPPPASAFSSSVRDEQAKVRALEAEVRRLEAELGTAARLVATRARVAQARALVDELRRAPAPCDAAILARHLALDAPRTAPLLEVEGSRLLHPLEPQQDLRLRGLVLQTGKGRPEWRCERLPAGAPE